MQMVIDMPMEMYISALNGYPCGSETFVNAIKYGTPLPKGHGRLIDVDEVIKIANKKKDLHGAIWNAPTIIEADKMES